MNQWTWLFKKFPYFNKATSIKTRAVAGGILGGIVILGCQNLMRPQPTSGSAPAMAMEDKSHIVASIKVFLQDANQKEAYIGDFDRTTCVDGLPTVWVASFASVFGEHRFDLDYTAIADHKANTINVKNGAEHFQIATEAYPKAIASQGLCDLPFRTDSTHLPADSEAGKELMSVLTNVAPDCRFETVDGKLSCNIGHASEQDVRGRLEVLTKNMSTKWNHQPYLLIRRLTLTKQLLEASQLNDDFKAVHKFCRVIEASLPNELPLAFRSKVWQAKVCHSKNPEDKLLMVGLDQAVREIESLAHRIEDTSLVGTFTLAVPHDKSPVKEYWITLQPLDLPVLVKAENTILTPCVWHPIFADQMDKALIAMDLGQLSSTSSKSFCSPVPDLAKAKKDSDNYIRASIASEMEFPIVNGQSKLLRLPTGDYKYNITQLNGPFSEEMFTTEEIIPISIGQVSWKTNRPHLIIKNW
ncbi:MAG: hypothetical protein EOP07_12210 [Proteobacteria bacterium]|nr:MAG: hypothetical protein EOP07_12210 [Pseudomonadota bacterium]